MEAVVVTDAEVPEVEVTDIDVVEVDVRDAGHGRWSRLPQSVVATALAVTLLYGGMAQGGFHGSQFRILLVLTAIASVLALAAGLRPRMGAWIPAAGFLAVSTLLSALGAQALSAALPTLGLLAAMAAVTCIVDRLDDAAAEQVFFGLGSLGVLVAGSAWIGVAFRIDPVGRVADGLWRGSSTLTYSNAAASLIGAIMLMVAARVVGSSPDSESNRTLVRALLENVVLFLLATGLIVTQSRGGLVATAIGGLLLALRLGIVRTAVATAVPAIAALLAAGAALAASSIEVDSQPVSAVGGLMIGATIVALAPVAQRRFAKWRSGSPSKTIAASAIGLVVVAAVAIVLNSGSFSDIAERRLTLSSNTAAGEVVLFGDRSHEWKAALEQVERRPLLGVGPGQLLLRWQEDDGFQYSASFVHNEYLELAATHGLLGVVAALLGGALVVDEIRRRRVHQSVHHRWGAYAALITLLAHSALDYLWHLPLVPLVMATVVGLLLRRPTCDNAVPSGGRTFA